MDFPADLVSFTEESLKENFIFWAVYMILEFYSIFFWCNIQTCLRWSSNWEVYLEKKVLLNLKK